MPRPTDLVHSEIVQELGRFTKEATIQQDNPTLSAIGDVQNNWINLHINVPAVIASSPSRGEVRRPNDTIAYSAWIVLLDGDYSGITTAMRVVIEDISYDILRVERASIGIITRLTVEKVN